MLCYCFVLLFRNWKHVLYGDSLDSFLGAFMLMLLVKIEDIEIEELDSHCEEAINVENVHKPKKKRIF